MIPCRNVLSGSGEASQISSQVSCASKKRRLLNCPKPAANRSLCSRAAFSAAALALLGFIQNGFAIPPAPARGLRLLSVQREAADRRCALGLIPVAFVLAVAFVLVLAVAFVLAVALALSSHSERSEESLHVTSSQRRPLCVAQQRLARPYPRRLCSCSCCRLGLK